MIAYENLPSIQASDSELKKPRVTGKQISVEVMELAPELHDRLIKPHENQSQLE